MSQLRTNSITNISNTGDANIVLGSNGDTQVQSLNGSHLAGFRNQIINGDFRVWQRGTSGSISPGNPEPYNDAYTADRWKLAMLRPTGVATFDWRQYAVTDSALPHNYALEVDVVATNSNGYHSILQGIENAQALPAGTYNLSFWATGPGSAIEVRVRAFYGAGNSDNEDFKIQQVTPTGTWQKFTVPVTITDQRSKTNTPDSMISIGFTLEGDGLAHQAGQWRFTGVQLEPGPVATPFENRFIGTELALCQRYFLKDYGSGVGTLIECGSASNGIFYMPTPTMMRKPPTLQGNLSVYNTRPGDSSTNLSISSTNVILGGVHFIFTPLNSNSMVRACKTFPALDAEL